MMNQYQLSDGGEDVSISALQFQVDYNHRSSCQTKCFSSCLIIFVLTKS